MDAVERERERTLRAGDLRVDGRGVTGREVVAVNCWPGKMSAAAARPLRYAGSEMAPTSTSFRGRVVGAYIDWLATSVPGVPCGISCFATSTGVGAFSPPTRAR